MLWNLIYEFFIKYIFGGVWTNNEHYGAFYTYIEYQGGGYNYYTSEQKIHLFDLDIPLGNYMSLIATIITMIIVLIVIGHFIKKAFNLFGRII